MTDIEYNIKAAEAAGKEWVTQKVGGGEKEVMVGCESVIHGGMTCDTWESWDPIASNKDALELAAILGIVVQDTSKGSIATCIDIPGTEGRGHIVGSDRHAARRFAIVQCAVSALGKVPA